ELTVSPGGVGVHRPHGVDLPGDRFAGGALDVDRETRQTVAVEQVLELFAVRPQAPAGVDQAETARHTRAHRDRTDAGAGRTGSLVDYLGREGIAIEPRLELGVGNIAAQLQ